MKRIIIFLGLVTIVACAKISLDTQTMQKSTQSTDFYKNGVHITISKDSVATKSGEDETAIITGEKENASLSLKVISHQEGDGMVIYETYTMEGDKVCTDVFHNGKLVMSEIADQENTQGTKGVFKRYFKCVTEKARDLNENDDNDPWDSAVCEWIPCKTINLIIAAIDCL